MKTCRTCGVTKPAVDFYVARKRFLFPDCKPCYIEHCVERRRKDPKYVPWRNKSPENLERHREMVRKASLALQKTKPEAYAAAAARRRAVKLRATPSWADHDLIDGFYALAKTYSEHMGCKFHVDHVVPLSSPLVCGLHVQDNLDIVPAAVNFAKNNLHWPDMP